MTILRNSRNQEPQRELHGRIEINARAFSVQAHDSSQKFPLFEFAVGMRMCVALGGEFFVMPRTALAYDTVNINVIASAEQRDVSETNSGVIRAANHRYIARPHPGKHARAMHAQRNPPVFC